MELDNSLELKLNTIYCAGIFFNGYNAKSLYKVAGESNETVDEILKQMLGFGIIH